MPINSPSSPSQTLQLAYELIEDAELDRVVGGAAVAIPALIRNSGRLSDDAPIETLSLNFQK